MKPTAFETRQQDLSAIQELFKAYTVAIDSQELDVWVDLFTGDAKYKVITVDNYERGYILGLMDDTKPRMKDRVTFIRNFWNTEKIRYRHLAEVLSVDQESEGSYCAVSNFTVFETKPQGATHLLAVGQYRDKVVKVGEVWKFLERLVVLDTTLVTEMQFPL